MGSPPVTMLISSRPFDRRSNVAAMRAATPGETSPGRTATRNFIALVDAISAEEMIQASSQDRPWKRIAEGSSLSPK